MALTYDDIKAFVNEGKTAAEIATILQTDGRHARDITIRDLIRTLVNELDVLRVVNGRFTGPLADGVTASGDTALIEGFLKLETNYALVTQRILEPDFLIRLNSVPQYGSLATGLTQLVQADPTLSAEQRAYVQQVMDNLTGGRLYAGFESVTEADVQQVITDEVTRQTQEQEQQQALEALRTKRQDYSDVYATLYNTHIASYLDQAATVNDLTPAGLEAAINAAATAARTALGG